MGLTFAELMKLKMMGVSDEEINAIDRQDVARQNVNAPALPATQPTPEVGHTSLLGEAASKAPTLPRLPIPGILGQALNFPQNVAEGAVREAGDFADKWNWEKAGEQLATQPYAAKEAAQETLAGAGEFVKALPQQIYDLPSNIDKLRTVGLSGPVDKQELAAQVLPVNPFNAYNTLKEESNIGRALGQAIGDTGVAIGMTKAFKGVHNTPIVKDSFKHVKDDITGYVNEKVVPRLGEERGALDIGYSRVNKGAKIEKGGSAGQDGVRVDVPGSGRMALQEVVAPNGRKYLSVIMVQADEVGKGHGNVLYNTAHQWAKDNGYAGLLSDPEMRNLMSEAMWDSFEDSGRLHRDVHGISDKTNFDVLATKPRSGFRTDENGITWSPGEPDAVPDLSTVPLKDLNRMIGEAKRAGDKPLMTALLARQKELAAAKPAKELTPTAPVTPPNAEGFYSPIIRAVEESPQKSFTPEQALAFFKNKNNVTSERVDWAGVKEFVQGKKQITREELLAHLQAKEPKLGRTSNQSDWTDAMEAEYLALLKKEDEWNFGSTDDPQDWTQANQARLRELDDLRAVTRQVGSAREPKFENYKLPGESENYREQLTELGDPTTNASQLLEAALAKAGLDEQAISRMQDTWTTGGREQAAQLAPEALAAFEHARKQADAQPYQSGHWQGTPNVLWHTRATDRTIGGKPTHFMEEVQSDWHQAGAKRGYKDGSQPWEVFDPKDGKPITTFATEAEAKAYVAQPGNGHLDYADTPMGSSYGADKRVPNAPFKSTWEENAVKQQILEAVKNDKDQFAWTTGQQQADRYGLEKHFEELQAIPSWPYGEEGKTPPAHYSLRGRQTNGQGYSSELYTRVELDDLVGKDLAARLTNEVPERDGFAIRRTGGSRYAGDDNLFYDDNGQVQFFMDPDEAQAFIDDQYASSANFGQHQWQVVPHRVKGRFPVLRGDDLKYGGEGMFEAYDKRIPSIVKRVTGQEPQLTPNRVYKEKDVSYIRQLEEQLKAEEAKLADPAGFYRGIRGEEPTDLDVRYIRENTAVNIQGLKDVIASYGKEEPVWSVPLTPEFKAWLKKNGLPLTALAAATYGAQFLEDKEAGVLSAIISPALARRLPVERTIGEGIDHPANVAVGNMKGHARLTPDGLELDIARSQKPYQAGDTSVRSGVFYSPKGTTHGEYYDATKAKGRANPHYGGDQPVEGTTLLKNPFVTDAGGGGRLGEKAIATVLGKKKFQELQRRLPMWVSRSIPPGVQIDNIRAVLKDFGADPDLADPIFNNSREGNQLRYAVQEAVAAAALRSAGYDSALGMKSAFGNPKKFTEFFDVRERDYPVPGEEGVLMDLFQEAVDKGETRLNPYLKGQLDLFKHGKLTKESAAKIKNGKRADQQAKKLAAAEAKRTELAAKP